MYLLYIYSGFGQYLTYWICDPPTRVIDIKRYAALWMKLPVSEITIRAFDVSEKPLPNLYTFNEDDMPMQDNYKYVNIHAAAAFVVDDHKIRHNASAKPAEVRVK